MTKSRPWRFARTTNSGSQYDINCARTHLHQDATNAPDLGERRDVALAQVPPASAVPVCPTTDAS